MLKALLITAALVLPCDLVARDQCASLTRHHLYDECGKPVFVQMVAWEESGRCFFWRMAKEDTPLIPKRVSNGWVLTWEDGGILREVFASSYDSGLHTQWDIEVADRELLPVEQRRRLKGAK